MCRSTSRRTRSPATASRPRGRRWSSTCWWRWPASRVRCSPGSCCSSRCGATGTPPTPGWSTSTCSGCAPRSSATRRSPRWCGRCAAWATRRARREVTPGSCDRAAVTRTDLPGTEAEVLVSPERERLFRARQEALRVRRGARRRAGVYRRRLRHTSRRLAARALHSWRSSLQVRIGAITMAVAGTVVVIVSLVLFSQIRDQLLSVKRQAAVDQAQAGVLYAQGEITGGIATGDAASVRATLDRTVNALLQRGGAAGDFDLVMTYRTGDREVPGASRAFIYAALPDDLRADVDAGNQSYRYAEIPDPAGEPRASLVVGAPVQGGTAGTAQIELYYVFPLSQEAESLSLI